MAEGGYGCDIGGLDGEIVDVGRNQEDWLEVLGMWEKPGGLVRGIGDVGRNQGDWLERLGMWEETRGTG